MGKKGFRSRNFTKVFSFFLTFKWNCLLCNPRCFNHNKLGRQKRLSVRTVEKELLKFLYCVLPLICIRFFYFTNLALLQMGGWTLRMVSSIALTNLIYFFLLFVVAVLIDFFLISYCINIVIRERFQLFIWELGQFSKERPILSHLYLQILFSLLFGYCCLMFLIDRGSELRRSLRQKYFSNYLRRIT